MKKYQIESIEIPEILESDILETIQQSRYILKQREEKKYETDSWKLKFEMLLRFGKYSFLIQLCLCFGLLLGSWLSLGIQHKNVTIAFYLTGNILLSISMTVDQLRSRIMMMSELEKTCPYSLEKLYGLKVAVSSFIVLLGIVLSSFILSSDSQFDFLVLLKGGCIPFFFLNALCLNLEDEIGGTQMIISSYILIVLLSLILPLYSFQLWLFIIKKLGTYGLVLSLGYFMVMYKKKYWVITHE